MDKLFIYSGITIGSILGSYLPVWLFGVNPLGAISILAGSFGALIGLWAGYKLQQNFNE